MHLSFPFQQFVLSHSSPMEIFSDSLLPILKNLKQHQSPSFVFLSSPLLLSFLLTPSLSLAVTLCVLMELSHCLGWNEKNIYTNTEDLTAHVWINTLPLFGLHEFVLCMTDSLCFVLGFWQNNLSPKSLSPCLSTQDFQPKSFNWSLLAQVFLNGIPYLWLLAFP